jgi:hypothetical protein
MINWVTEMNTLTITIIDTGSLTLNYYPGTPDCIAVEMFDLIIAIVIPDATIPLLAMARRLS